MVLNDIKYYVNGILSKDRSILSKTITLIESSLEKHQKLAQDIITQLLPHTGKSTRVGITGPPGVGKSTLIENMGLQLVENNHKVAVLAVDPSSLKSGGSIMADKTRMEKLSAKLNAFIRPSPSGGVLGGVAQKTKETMLICEAAGFDVILIETVGVGQSEIKVSSMVDFFLLLMLANAGDEIQGIKKGVMELADLIVVNKADGNFVNAANIARKQLESAVHYTQGPDNFWKVAVLTCSARQNIGIDEIWKTIQSYITQSKKTGNFLKKRNKQSLDWMWQLIDEKLKAKFYNNKNIKKLLPKIIQQVKDKKKSPTSAVDTIFEIY